MFVLSRSYCIKILILLSFCTLIFIFYKYNSAYLTAKNLFDKWNVNNSFKKYVEDRECSVNITLPSNIVTINRNPLSWTSLAKKFGVYTNNHNYPAENVFLNNSKYTEELFTSALTWAIVPTKQHQHDTKSSIEINSGGIWRPLECTPTQKLAIIVPFRDRDFHLRIFINHMHSFLRHQNLMYTIFIVNQNGTTAFNRAALMNVGFIESSRIDNYDCYIFHDVDLLPQDYRNFYRCSTKPIHLSVAVDKFDYRLPYSTIFGGAVALSREQFVQVNGFPNIFFGWGGEDDDMYYRVTRKYEIHRYPNHIARYIMLMHKHEKYNEPNAKRFKLLETAASRAYKDGFKTCKYNLIQAYSAYGGLFYWISVDISIHQ